MEENNPRFFAGHVGGDAGLAQRLKYRSQLIFSDGEVATDHDVLITTGKCAQVFTPIVLSRSTLWILAGCPKVNLIIPCSATNILLAT